MTPRPVTLPNGATCALSLTYDDALPCHRTVVAAALERRGLRGTFFIPAAADDLHAHPDAWRDLAARGHELGSHSIWHPCRNDCGQHDGWLEPTYDLRAYSRRRFLDEAKMADRVLRLIDGRTARSYGATCGDVAVGDGATREDLGLALTELHPVVRVGRTSPTIGVPLSAVGSQVPTCGMDRRTAADLLATVRAAVESGTWLISTAHGVGASTHSHFIAPDEHERFLDGVAAMRDVWIAPMLTVYEHVAGQLRA